MEALAKENLETCRSKRPILKREIKVLMLPKDPNDDKNIIMEIQGLPVVTKRVFLLATC